MYATAHRVKSRQGQVGINAFLHKHGEGDSAGIDWDKIDMRYVTEQATGGLVSEHTEIAPGGNQVLSYLDVVCPDEMQVEQIEEAVVHAKAALTTSLRPLERSFGRIVVRFGAAFGLREAEGVEYDALANEVLNIIRRGVAPVWLGKAPLHVVVTRSEDGFAFGLAEDDKQRALAAREVSLPYGVVRIDYDTYDDFERLYGDLMMHILPTVTGLTLDQLRSEGGVAVIQADTGRMIWEWPRRREHS